MFEKMNEWFTNDDIKTNGDLLRKAALFLLYFHSSFSVYVDPQQLENLNAETFNELRAESVFVNNITFPAQDDVLENKYTQNTYVLVNIPHYTVANHIKTIKTHAFFSKNKKYD